jgi:hypothetical protein
MTTTTAHTVDDALEEFTLIRGVGSEASKEACARSLLAWIKGEPFGDAPGCAHPILNRYIVAANDHSETTETMRKELVRAGYTGLLETWWVPGEVVLWALSAPKGTSPTAYERTVGAFALVAEWKEAATKERPNLGGADLGGADLREADLGGANLRGADLRLADLGGANLREADLRGADLREANLRGADLGEANLRGADLGEANLRGADLREADLREADLGGANLGGADLREANLRGADLGGADLGEANLRGANLGGANLGGANLGGARGNARTTLPGGWKVSDSGLIVGA